MKIQFLGARGEVTGSSYLVTCQDGMRLLVDMGMFQGPSSVENLNYLPFIFNPANLTAVFVTHAHLDHCGKLPMLVFKGFNGKIYMTSATEALIALNLTDAAKIEQESLTHEPLYGLEEVEKVMKMIEVVDYDQEIHLGNQTITFKNAGHILGSASIKILDKEESKETSIIFSGDLGNTPEDIVKPTDY